MSDGTSMGGDVLVVLLVTAVAAGCGGLAGGSIGAVIGGGFGLAAGLAAGAAGIRPLVTLVVAVATAAGVVVGQSVVAALCRPGSCVALEVTGGAAAGIGALIGTGLVVALVARSFDEYRQNAPPPQGPVDPPKG